MTSCCTFEPLFHTRLTSVPSIPRILMPSHSSPLTFRMINATCVLPSFRSTLRARLCHHNDHLLLSRRRIRQLSTTNPLKSLQTLFNPTDEHLALRSTLRSFVEREVRSCVVTGILNGFFTALHSDGESSFRKICFLCYHSSLFFRSNLKHCGTTNTRSSIYLSFANWER